MYGAELIAAERVRHMFEEGWTEGKDDMGTEGELSDAAAAYAIHCNPSQYAAGRTVDCKDVYPWHHSWWKPGDTTTTEGRIRCLVKAGALIAAEIDRLQRLEAAKRLTGEGEE